MKKIFYVSMALLAIFALNGCKMQGGVANMTFTNIGGIAAEITLRGNYINLAVGESYTYEVAWLGGKNATVKVYMYPDLPEEYEHQMTIPMPETYILSDGDHEYIDVEFYLPVPE